MASHSLASCAGLLPVRGVNRPAVYGFPELHQDRASVPQDGGARVFGGVEAGDVATDEPGGGAEGRSGRRREVAPPSTDAYDNVRLPGQGVGRGSPGRADGPNGLGVVVGERTLARLRLRHGDAGRLCEGAERVGGLRVDHTSAGHQERTAGPAQNVLARASAAGSGTGRSTCQVRGANSSSGQSKASIWTS